MGILSDAIREALKELTLYKIGQPMKGDLTMDPLNQPGHIFDGLDKFRPGPMPTPADPRDHATDAHRYTTAAPAAHSYSMTGTAVGVPTPTIPGPHQWAQPYEEALEELASCFIQGIPVHDTAGLAPYDLTTWRHVAYLVEKGHRVYYDVVTDTYHLTPWQGATTFGLRGVVTATNHAWFGTQPDQTADLQAKIDAAVKPACSCAAYFKAFKKHAELCPLYGSNP